VLMVRIAPPDTTELPLKPAISRLSPGMGPGLIGGLVGGTAAASLERAAALPRRLPSESVKER
jgi:hypothetical protein